VPDANVLNDAPYTTSNNCQMGLFGFAGSIDEVRMWNIAKTQSEIQAAMNTTLQGNESNLAAYYNLIKVLQQVITVLFPKCLMEQ